MKILDTDWEICEFADAWAIALDYAPKHVTMAAMNEARAANAVSLVSGDGVVSVRLVPDASGRMRAFVLMAVSTCFAGAFARNEAAMVAIARDMGADRLAFRTHRRGWTRLLGPQWRREGDVYERGV